MADKEKNVNDSKAVRIVTKLLNQLSKNVSKDEYKSDPNLTKLPDIQVLSDRVICILGQNPGMFTLQGTNTYLIGTGKKRFLIDTGEGIKSYINVLKKAMKENGVESIEGIICTHYHHDHIDGIPSIHNAFGKDIPIYKYYSDSKESKLNNKFIKIVDKQIFKCEGATLICHYTPGHCDDHIALELMEENAIFSGDCILGEGSCVFDDLYSYMLSLKKLLTFKCDCMFPGHGPRINDAQKKINEYINHRNDREKQIINVLKNNKSIDSWKICDIVYDTIPQRLKKQAHKSLMHHLNKLIMEQKVKKKKKKNVNKIYHQNHLNI
eukprot:319763_1